MCSPEEDILFCEVYRNAEHHQWIPQVGLLNEVECATHAGIKEIMEPYGLFVDS